MQAKNKTAMKLVLRDHLILKKSCDLYASIFLEQVMLTMIATLYIFKMDHAQTNAL